MWFIELLDSIIFIIFTLWILTEKQGKALFKAIGTKAPFNVACF